MLSFIFLESLERWVLVAGRNPFQESTENFRSTDLYCFAIIIASFFKTNKQTKTQKKTTNDSFAFGITIGKSLGVTIEHLPNEEVLDYQTICLSAISLTPLL